MYIDKYNSDIMVISQFVNKVFPEVERELKKWREYAKKHSEASLSYQALASIKHKRFHAQGGSIYSLYPGVNTKKAIEFIVAYQTISDYLDNLCDRGDTQQEHAFSQLHLAMTEALNPNQSPSDYYLYYPYKEDGGYLRKLVSFCQGQLSNLPGLNSVQSQITKLAHLYSQLQTYKHLDSNIREKKMLEWIKRALKNFRILVP